MLSALYAYTIFAGAVCTALLAVCLLLSRAPKTEIYRPYDRARKLLGASLCFFAAGIGVFAVFPLRSMKPDFAPALNLTYFYPAALLFGYAFIQLLDRDYYCPRRSRRFLWSGIAYVALLWTLTLATAGTARRVILILFAACFLTEAFVLVIRFFKTFRRVRDNIGNYYSDRVDLFVRWLWVSSLLIITCGVAGGVMAFLPGWCNTIYMAVGIGTFTYIYISLQNYVLNYERVEMSAMPDTPETGTSTDSGVTARDGAPAFLDSLERWRAENGYCRRGITIVSLAETLGTNRTYLSGYINSTLGKSFGEWINGMRLEHARQLLADDPAKSMEEIADLCGFSSQGYFSRLFKGAYGIPPLAYRKQTANR